MSAESETWLAVQPTTTCRKRELGGRPPIDPWTPWGPVGPGEPAPTGPGGPWQEKARAAERARRETRASGQRFRTWGSISGVNRRRSTLPESTLGRDNQGVDLSKLRCGQSPGFHGLLGVRAPR